MKWKALSLTLILSLLCSCSYNPFLAENHETGSPAGAAVGAGVGAGGVALLGGSRAYIWSAGLIGGAVGYYMTTLRYDSGGVMQAGGKVYKVGDFVGIYIPTDNLFEPNSSEFSPYAEPILQSTALVLKRYPRNNILISGNTSGFARARWEQKISERRAQKVAAYLWNAGINNFIDDTINMRKLNYVGYGDFFPIASHLTNEGIRQNSRIQITSYPSNADLGLDKCKQTMFNMGETDDRGEG